MKQLLQNSIIALLLSSSTQGRHTSGMRSHLASASKGGDVFSKQTPGPQISNQEKLYLYIAGMQDDMNFGDIANYSYDVADKAEEFKTLGQIKIENEIEKQNKKIEEKKQKATIVQKTKKVEKKLNEDEKKYEKIKQYNQKRDQMNKIQKEMDDLKNQIIAEKRKELASNDKKQDDDFNFDKAQMDVFATKLAVMAKESDDNQMRKNIEDSVFLQINEGDESLANVEIDSGDSSAEQALGAQGALDDNQNAALEQTVALNGEVSEEAVKPKEDEAVQVQSNNADLGQEAMSSAASELAAATGIGQQEAAQALASEVQAAEAGGATADSSVESLAQSSAVAEESISSETSTETSASSGAGAGIGSDSDDVRQTKLKFAQMQAQMEANIAEVENKRAAQQTAFENQNSDNPADQLKGLMTAQQSLKRMTSAFSSKSVTEKIQEMGAKLGIDVPPEILALKDNEQMSGALVELAVGMGKSEQEIAIALG